VVTGPREGGDVRGSPRTAIMILEISYLNTCHVMCITPIQGTQDQPHIS
jgi:hypothetical protein